jgi:hypothetical protein
LAQVHADVDAHEAEEDIEEVEFADLAAICAKVDAAEWQVASRGGIIQEPFAGMYNQVKDTTQVSSTSRRTLPPHIVAHSFKYDPFLQQ